MGRLQSHNPGPTCGGQITRTKLTGSGHNNKSDEHADRADRNGHHQHDGGPHELAPTHPHWAFWRGPTAYPTTAERLLSSGNTVVGVASRFLYRKFNRPTAGGELLDPGDQIMADEEGLAKRVARGHRFELGGGLQSRED
jgi:hypothetical protein